MQPYAGERQRVSVDDAPVAERLTHTALQPEVTMQVVIDGSARIVLPESVQQRLSMKPGMMLDLEIVGPSVHLTPVELAPLVDSGGILVFGGELESDAEGVSEELEQERMRKLSGI